MKILKYFLRALLVLVVLIVLFAAGVAIFMKVSPQFGAIPEGERLEAIKASANFKGGVFVNLVSTNMDMGLSEVPALLMEYMNDAVQREPAGQLPVRWDEGTKEEVDSLAYITWYGHSAVLLEMEGKRILLDPMLGPASSPVPFLTKRFAYEQGIDLSAIKDIDAVLISHDHYDHLDYVTITTIMEEVGHFYTALGVGEHLRRWGVPDDKITELDWWQVSFLENIELVAAPARHFSGRGFSDRNKTQWASWVIRGKNNRVYFSGDGGYGPHFDHIGKAYGPFDFAMVECGQYNERWAEIHMMPEESVQAGVDLNAEVVMPIHWGAFNLSLHDWRDPVLRAQQAAVTANVNLVSPYIGERFEIHQQFVSENWWEQLVTAE